MRNTPESLSMLREAAHALLKRENMELSANSVKVSQIFIQADLEGLPLAEARRLLRSVRGVRTRLMLALQASGEDEAWGYHLRDAYGLTGLGQLVERGAEIVRERSRAQARERLRLRLAA